MCCHAFLNGIFPTWGSEHASLMSPALAGRCVRKDSGARKDWRQEEKGTSEDELIGWHHQLNGHEFEQVSGVGDGQGSLECCGPWGCKESDMAERLNWTEHRLGSGVLEISIICLLAPITLGSMCLCSAWSHHLLCWGGGGLTFCSRTQRCVSDCSPHLLCGGTGTLPPRRRVGDDLVTKPPQQFLRVELKSLIRTLSISGCLPFQRKVDVLPIEYLQIGPRFSSMSTFCAVVTT